MVPKWQRPQLRLQVTQSRSGVAAFALQLACGTAVPSVLGAVARRRYQLVYIQSQVVWAVSGYAQLRFCLSVVLHMWY